MFEVNNTNTRTCQWRRSGVFIANFEHISHLLLVFLLLTLSNGYNSITHHYKSMFSSYEMLCAIWYHLYNLKNVKNTLGGMLLLVKLQAEPATLLKVTFLHVCFSHFLN